MELKYSDNVKLVIDITDQMKQDYRECEAMASIPGGAGKDCDGCSLNVNIEGVDLCELPLVTEALEEEMYGQT